MWIYIIKKQNIFVRVITLAAALMAKFSNCYWPNSATA